MARVGKIERKTKETAISLVLNLDGEGKADLNLPVPFMVHMLDLFARHGRFDLMAEARGDTCIDDHHTVEDLGICLGKALKEALGNKGGIERFGCAYVPMDEALVRTVLDLSGRPYLNFQVEFTQEKVGSFDLELIEEFLRAFANQSGTTLHITCLAGKNNHHMAEAIFKSLGRSLRDAVKITDLKGNIPSTKGSLE
ncbi:MAG TPA: imidazoleglycerol-phosphate dehydratase HisB [Clostridia bacterium]|nr:imidazoleglycerol-phosphate dehydratase HisB [Clostridia bacterium]